MYCALIGYIHYEAPVEEQNFSTLIEFINAMEVREDDEEFKNPVDLMFDALEAEKPNHFAVRQYSWLENYALEHSRSPEDILLEREEMTTRLHLSAALPAALAHATPTQARRVHAYYIAGIKQPEIARREGIHSSKVSVAIRRGLRNMRRCYDDLFQTE